MWRFLVGFFVNVLRKSYATVLIDALTLKVPVTIATAGLSGSDSDVHPTGDQEVGGRFSPSLATFFGGD